MKPLPFTGSAVALITPMDEHLAINFDKLGELIDFHLDQQTDALVVTATTGESATLSDREREQILSFTVDRVSRRIPVIAGVGSNCTDHACALSKRAQELGADALLHVTPYYNKASQQGLVAHFRCCAESASLPVILYNVPSRTGVNILPETYRQLSQIPNIVAVKEAGGNFSQIAKTAFLCEEKLHIYSGNDDQILPILALGGKGVISVLANILPRHIHELCQSFFEGNLSQARTLQLRCLELAEALFSDVNPIPVKHAMNLLGFEVGGCRLPLSPMEMTKAAALAGCLERYGILSR